MQCEPMTYSVKPIGVDKSYCRPITWHGMQNNTLVRHLWCAKSCSCSVEREEDGKSEGLNEGVDQHKDDGEMCGLDEWMV